MIQIMMLDHLTGWFFTYEWAVYLSKQVCVLDVFVCVMVAASIVLVWKYLSISVYITKCNLVSTDDCCLSNIN